MLERKQGNSASKFCYVVEELITLQELGFKEDEFHRWSLILSESHIHQKRLIASGDYLYLQELGKKDSNLYNRDIVAIWNKDIGGVIRKDILKNLIEILKAGNVREKEC